MNVNITSHIGSVEAACKTEIKSFIKQLTNKQTYLRLASAILQNIESRLKTNQNLNPVVLLVIRVQLLALEIT